MIRAPGKRSTAALVLLASVSLSQAAPAEPYATHCAFCHGTQGAGDGPAAARLPVPPADFTSGNFKLRSTPSGAMPTDQDLLLTVTRGIPGTGMPSFAFLPLAARLELVRAVKRLARPRGGGKGYFESRPAAPVAAVPPRPPATADGIARGKKLYRELACPACHGDKGRGDGRSAPELKDYAGRTIRPTDFTLGIFKRGADPRGLYLAIATGLNGTPMAQYGNDVITPRDRWALVDYLVTLVGNENAEELP